MSITGIEKSVGNGARFAGSMSAGSVSSECHNADSSPSTMHHVSEFLDRILPLENASHAEVIAYTVEIPTRYAKCFAVLNDGSKVALRNCRTFVGWLGRNHKRSFLFRTKGLQVEIQTDTKHPACRNAPGHVHQVIAEVHTNASLDGITMTAGHQKARIRKFIAIDGSQIILAGQT